MSGHRKRMILKDEPCKKAFRTIVLMGFFFFLAFMNWWVCRWIKKWPKFETEFYSVSWNYLWVIIYSSIVIYMTKNFKKSAAWIVTLENHKFMNDHEDSMISKTYCIAFVNCYLGLFAAAFFEQKFSVVTFTLATILIFKQVILNIRENRVNYKIYPKIFKHHESNFTIHCRNYPENYERFIDRRIHFVAEKQTLMGNQELLLVGAYNELCI